MNSERFARLADAVDRQNAETLTYQPMAPNAGDVNARPVPDDARPPLDFSGIWAEPFVEGARPHLNAETARGGGMRQVLAGRPTVKLQAGALPYDPARCDRLVRKLTGRRYEVAEVAGDGFGRVLLGLTARGG